jgi:DNA-binding MarR family transcriptional regulator
MSRSSYFTLRFVIRIKGGPVFAHRQLRNVEASTPIIIAASWVVISLMVDTFVGTIPKLRNYATIFLTWYTNSLMVIQDRIGMTPMSSNSVLTERQIATVHAIRAIQSRDGIPPSLDDIGQEMGVTKATAQYLVKTAIRKGLITKLPGKYRSIRLTAAASAIAEPKKKRAA